MECQYDEKGRHPDNKGYVKVWVRDPSGSFKKRALSRVVCARTYGLDIWDSTWVARHTCDNPPCVNPAHLIPGTMGDNNRDTVLRGRHVAHSRKLSAAQISEIVASKDRFQRDLAEQYGVTQATISKVRREHGVIDSQRRRPRRPFCSSGHAMTDENTFTAGGRYRCRECTRARDRERYYRRRGGTGEV